MASKIKPCKLGKRHKWNRSANVNKTSYLGSYVQISRVGVYECDCGARKFGPASLEVDA